MIFKKRKTFRVNGPRGLRFLQNLGNNAWKSYIENRMLTSSIHNDPGASFTQLKREGDKIIKFAEEKGEEKLKDEINWILKLQSTRFGKRYLPQIFNYSFEPGNVFYEMKYYSFPNLRKIIMDDMSSTYFLKKRWEKLLKIFFNVLYKDSNSAPPGEDFFQKTHSKKYHSRIEDTLKEAPYFEEILSSPVIEINGQDYINPTTILKYIEDHQELIERLTPEKVYLSHGDLHCNNILCGISAGQFIFLDCRGKSPDGSFYFDPAYDLAKLYHDLHSYYSLIEKELFIIHYNKVDKKPTFEYFFTDQTLLERFNRNYFYVRVYVEKHYKYFDDLHYRTDFNEALLYLTMLPMHIRKKNEGLVCFITGVVRLNQLLRKNHPEVNKMLLEDAVSGVQK